MTDGDDINRMAATEVLHPHDCDKPFILCRMYQRNYSKNAMRWIATNDVGDDNIMVIACKGTNKEH